MNGNDLKKIRDRLGFSQSKMAELLSVSLRTYQNYESKDHFSENLSTLINAKVAQSENISLPKYTEKVEPVKLNFRMVPVVNRYAYASYVDSWDDPEYIDTMQTLPTTELEDGNYLWFEVKGDSMSSDTYPSIEEGDFILGRELYRHHWEHLQLRRIKVWIIVHREKGILIKEIVKQNGNIITCNSWNPLIKPFDLNLDEINQLFYFKQLLRTKM